MRERAEATPRPDTLATPSISGISYPSRATCFGWASNIDDVSRRQTVVNVAPAWVKGEHGSIYFNRPFQIAVWRAAKRAAASSGRSVPFVFFADNMEIIARHPR